MPADTIAAHSSAGRSWLACTLNRPARFSSCLEMATAAHSFLPLCAATCTCTVLKDVGDTKCYRPWWGSSACYCAELTPKCFTLKVSVKGCGFRRPLRFTRSLFPPRFLRGTHPLRCPRARGAPPPPSAQEDKKVPSGAYPIKPKNGAPGHLIDSCYLVRSSTSVTIDEIAAACVLGECAGFTVVDASSHPAALKVSTRRGPSPLVMLGPEQHVGAPQSRPCRCRARIHPLRLPSWRWRRCATTPRWRRASWLARTTTTIAAWASGCARTSASPPPQRARTPPAPRSRTPSTWTRRRSRTTLVVRL